MGGKRLLVIGGSTLQMPAILRAQETGFSVAVVDWDPSAPGAQAANVFYNVSTNDSEGVLASARDFQADGIITIGTDRPMRALAFACQSLGLRAPTERAAFNATDKVAMHASLSRCGIALPASVAVDSAELLDGALELEFPLIVKPADSSGSRGITKVLDRYELADAYEFAKSMSPTGRVIVQQFVVGDEVSVEGFCVGPEPTVVTITDKRTSGAPHFVELGHSQPTLLSVDQQEAVIGLVKKAAFGLELADCAFHAEVMVTVNGPIIIEVGARLGGDFISSHLVPLSTGVNMIDALIAVALGQTPDLRSTRSCGSAVRFLERQGKADQVSKALLIDGVVEVALVDREQGTLIQSSTDRAGHVIAVAESASTAVAAAEHAVKMLT